MRFRFKRVPGGVIGAIEMPTLHAPGKIIAASLGDDRADALAKAALVAERITQDPVLRALMPPQAAAAISAAKGLAVAASQGTHALRGIWHRIHGDGKKRLAAVLHAEASELERQEPKPGEVGWNPFRRRKKRARALERRRLEREEQPDDEGQPEEQSAPEQAPENADNGDDEGDAQ